MNKSEIKLVIINDMLAGGGRERRIVQLVAGLKKLGLTNIFLILLNDRIDYPEIFDLNINIITIKRHSNRDFSVFLKLYSIIKEINPTVVNPWSFMSIFYAAPICLALKIPCIGSFVVDAKRPKIFSINWIAMHIGFFLCKKIIGNSIAGHTAYQTPIKKRVVIYNGFNESRLTCISSSKLINKPIQIAMIGRLDRQKDFITYIDAIAILKRKQIEFTPFIVGQGDQIEGLKAYSATNCDDKIIFTGFIKDIDSFIYSIDIGILCTDPKFHAEGISNALLEIMAQGKPVIATDGGGTPEIVIDGSNGFLVPPYDSLTLAERIHQLISDRSLRAILGDNAAKTVISKFSLQKMSSEFLQTYHECL